MGKFLKRAVTSWKTSLAGVVVLVSTVGPYTGVINTKQAEAIAGAAIAFGLIKAKDNNVTGGSKAQS